MIKAALLDAQGRYLRIDELEDELGLTPRHLPQITECDLPPKRYRWIADPDNPARGAFWPVEWVEKIERTRAEAAQQRERAAAYKARRAKRR